VQFPEPALSPQTEMSLEVLNGFDIVLSGYWEIPGGTTAEQVRAARETEADAILYEIAAQLSHAGASTDIELTFGEGGETEREYQNRLADEVDADAILLADHLSTLLNILVPLRDSRHQEEIVDFVSAFDSDGLFILELYHVAADDAAAESAAAMLESVEQTLLERGFTDADIEITVEVADDPKAAIAATAEAHHLVVIGETQQSGVKETLFGPVCQYIAEESATPVAVVRDR
jgi:nucleotide-binding universal stress UspA family protein